MKNFALPSAIAGMGLDPLLRLLRYAGTAESDSGGAQFSMQRTELRCALQLAAQSAQVLHNWPEDFRGMLRRRRPAVSQIPSKLGFAAVYGNAFETLFSALPKSEFGFLHQEFESFVADEWSGIRPSQTPRLSVATRENSSWCSEACARKLAGATNIRSLIPSGEVEASVVKCGRSRQYWYKRDSLLIWLSKRDADRASYMSTKDAAAALGLSRRVTLTLARTDMIRSVEGGRPHFPHSGEYLNRADVTAITLAFEKHLEYPAIHKRQEPLVTLGHAINTGRIDQLPVIIRAVANGSVVPVGNTSQSRGIAGYLFRISDLRPYQRNAANIKNYCKVITYRDAASTLRARTAAVAGLVRSGQLTLLNEYRCGCTKLLSAEEVNRFNKKYVALSVLAKRWNTGTSTIAAAVRKEAPAARLSIPIPGQGQAVFVCRALVERIRHHVKRRGLRRG